MTYTGLPGIPRVVQGDDLADIITAALRRADLGLADGDVLVIAQKIVSKAEGRSFALSAFEPSSEAHRLSKLVGKDPRHIEAILSESTEVVRAAPGVLIVAHRLGFVMANAGIDQSNVGDGSGEEILLLPRDPDASSSRLKAGLDARHKADIGVVINDSFGRPWRNGVVGVAIGAAGIPSLQSLVGAPDLYGRALRVTEVALADELAAGASLVMGQSAEGLPVVHVRGFGARGELRNAASLIRPKGQDLFR
ncbi:MAG: coenzyme F420-0:L-glutamate ligase / coenzyme F420:gamma-L-glutamate ligase [Hyphomicrobiales bacterium]|nr:coenzyme F420-0:L-glutamate ligase / coenzyme F420:gamma-L-glutamate ligase [Hyphomicrobiales bacterium]